MFCTYMQFKSWYQVWAFFFLFEIWKAKCIKSSFLYLLLCSLVWLTHFIPGDGNTHLTVNICPTLRVHSLTRVVFHPPHKSHPEPAVCMSACGMCISEHKQGCFSYDVASCFAALNHQHLSKNSSSLKLATMELGVHWHPHTCSLWSHHW